MTGCVGPIESQTLTNTHFRKVLFTGKRTQLVVIIPDCSGLPAT